MGTQPSLQARRDALAVSVGMMGPQQPPDQPTESLTLSTSPAPAVPEEPVKPSKPTYVAVVNCVCIAKSNQWQTANARIYFPIESLRKQYFEESSKLWR